MESKIQKSDSSSFQTSEDKNIGIKPIYWKQVLLSTFTVYPLLLLVSWLLRSLFPMQDLNPEIATFFAVLGVASLMVFPVMPLALKFLGPWLHKK